MMTTTLPFSKAITQGIPTEIPAERPLDDSVPHAPKRNISLLTHKEWLLAIENALRYFPKEWHSELASEFNEELKTHGRIYMHRFRPEYDMVARPIHEYPAKTPAAAAIMNDSKQPGSQGGQISS